jgi:hypothetical protein
MVEAALREHGLARRPGDAASAPWAAPSPPASAPDVVLAPQVIDVEPTPATVAKLAPKRASFEGSYYFLAGALPGDVYRGEDALMLGVNVTGSPLAARRGRHTQHVDFVAYVIGPSYPLPTSDRAPVACRFALQRRTLSQGSRAEQLPTLSLPLRGRSFPQEAQREPPPGLSEGR